MLESRSRSRYGDLLRLWMRRSLSPAWVGLVLGTAILLSMAQWTPGALEAGGDSTPRLGRGLERQALWTISLILLTTWAAWHGAQVMSRWRAGEWAWIGSRPTHSLRVWIATWAGASAGLGLLLLGVAVVVEVGAGLGEETLQRVGTLPLEGEQVLEPGASHTLKWNEVGPETGWSRLVLRTSPGWDPTTDVELRADRGGEVTTAAARLDGRREVEVALPPLAGGGLTLRVSNTGGGALILGGDAPLELWRPGGGEWRGSLAVLWRAFLSLAAVFALAMGLGGRVSPASAAGLTLALILLVTTRENPELLHWIPCADLPAVLGVLGEGRLPTAAHPMLAIISLGLGPLSWILAGRVR